jgi:outer membrane protein
MAEEVGVMTRAGGRRSARRSANELARVVSLAGLSLLLAGGVALPVVAGCGAGTRVGFVDMQRAINETRDGKQTKVKLREIYGERQRDLDKRQELLRQMEQRINAQKSNENAEAYDRDMSVYQAAVAELQSAYKTYQGDLEIREADAVKSIVVRMKELLAELAARDGYNAVIEVNEGGAFYYNKGLDLTAEVIRLYDERFPPAE